MRRNRRLWRRPVTALGGFRVASRNRIEWGRRPPKRAAVRLGWTVLAAVFVCGPAWLLFSGEPGLLADDAVNPLALILPVLAVAFGGLLVPQALALVRRPVVAADYYALTVRPGVFRTLVLPWAQLAELCLREIDEEAILLIRCGARGPRSADWPRWWDQAGLRAARRGDTERAVAAYDLAVPMDEFEGKPEVLLAELAQWAPGHVAVFNNLDGEPG
jgi:hypothetical protein